METYQVTVLFTLLVAVCSPSTLAQNIQGQFRYERQGGLLSGLTQFGGDFSIPSVSSGLETIAQNVRGIISTTKEAVEKLAQPVAFDFNAQLGLNGGQYGPGPDRFQENNQNNPPQYRPDNFNNGNFRVTTDNYPNYEIPNQHRTDGFNRPQIDAENGRNNQGLNGGVVTYTDNHFPVILLKENEIRR